MNTVWICISIMALIILIAYLMNVKEGFESAAFKSDKEYTKQVKLLSDTYSDASNGKRPLDETLANIPESEQIFTNFYSLGCRFTGYIGPVGDTYYDPDIAVQNAVLAGCRTFVLEIDYIQDCDTSKYFPTLVVRDKQGKLMIHPASNKPLCNSNAYSTIRDTCEKINYYAFAPSCQNATDPVTLVLYFLRQPPGGYDSTTVLTYFSNVAKMIQPLSTRFLKNEPTGTYYRQKQEGQILMNHINAYKNKVLLFSNANTSGFRGKQYPALDDLDFLVNLRLSYTQTQLGITDNTAGSTFGILETADNFMIIPTDRAENIVNDTKLKWTICLSKDPDVSVKKEVYETITQKFGVHCVPIIMYDIPNNQYMFSDKLFKKHSYIPKPKELRFVRPPVIVPAEPSKKMDANQGFLREPTIM